MAEQEQIPIKSPSDQLSPGDIVRFVFELKSENTVLNGEAVSSIKRTIWANDQFDYQGSEETIEDAKKILSVYASVRKTRRQQRGEIKYASLSTFEAEVKAAAIVWGEKVKWLKTTVQKVGQGVKAAAIGIVNTGAAGARALPTIGMGILLIAAVVFYAYFFGGPKRGN